MADVFLKNILMEKSVVNLHREGRLCFIFFKAKAFILEFLSWNPWFLKKKHHYLHETEKLNTHKMDHRTKSKR